MQVWTKSLLIGIVAGASLSPIILSAQSNLVSDSTMKVTLPQGWQRSPRGTINIEARDMTGLEGARVPLQRLLGSARNLLTQQCPQLTTIHFLVSSSGQTVFTGKLRSDNRWRLEEDVRGECDRLAAHPDDPKRRAIGVAEDVLDPTDAVFVCEAAQNEEGADPVITFQFARALWSADLFDEAVPLFAQAAQNGHVSSNAYLGDAYWNGIGGVEIDLEAAADFYQTAFAGGFTPARLYAQTLRVEIGNNCDRLAGHPSDPRKQTIGVADGQVKVAEAIEACTAANRLSPNEMRYTFQLGRALWLAREFGDAMPKLIQAADSQYPAALAYVGDALANGVAVDRDVGQAAVFYKASVDGGFTPAQAALTAVQASLPPPPAKLKLQCAAQFVNYSADRTPSFYRNSEFQIEIDWTSNTAKYYMADSQNFSVDGVDMFSARNYDVDVDGDFLLVDTEKLDPTARGYWLRVNMADGTLTSRQINTYYVDAVFMRIPTVNYLESEGWCREAPRAATKAATSKSAKAKKK